METSCWTGLSTDPSEPLSKGLLFLVIAAGLLVGMDDVFAQLVTDPVGDTFGSGAVQPDITSVEAQNGGNALTFTISFALAIAAPSQNRPESVTGYLDIDVDRQASTGATSFTELFSPGPALALGAEVAVDLFSEADHAGKCDVLDAQTGSVISTIPISYGLKNLTFSVPLALLSGSSGAVNYAVIVGTLDEATDRIPNGSTPLSTVPEPQGGSLAFAVIAVIAAMVIRRERLCWR